MELLRSPEAGSKLLRIRKQLVNDSFCVVKRGGGMAIKTRRSLALCRSVGKTARDIRGYKKDTEKGKFETEKRLSQVALVR